MAYTNRQWRLAARPVGMVKESDFELASEEIPGVAEGELLIRNLFLAFEPAQRGWIDDVESYVPPVQLGEVMRAGTVGQVIESKHPDFEKGQLVSGMFGWQEYYLTDGTPTAFGGVSRVPDGIPPQRVLSVLGATGMTAYFGIDEIHPVQEGDNVLVSGAAGATGSVAAQIARIRGAGKVVGIAGGPDKCRWLIEEAKLDAAIDYKNEDVRKRMRKEFPGGVDLYFDNVGGDILDAALLAMAERGRITMCGGISGYNEATPPPGPSNIMQVVIRRLSVKGFILFDHVTNAGKAIADLAKWSASGEIAVEEDIQEGFENTPKTFLRLFEGKNLGKQLIKIADPE